MIVYHKLSAEVTADDGRCWVVTVEPPLYLPEEGKPTPWIARLQWMQTRSELERCGPHVDLEYTIPNREGMFAALSFAINLVP